MRTIYAALAVACFACACLAQAAPTKTGDAVYQQLRSVSTGGEVVLVENVTLQRAGGTFTFKTGHLAFLAPIQGKVTGAVFVGEGSFSLQPPLAVERQNLKLLTKSDRFEETFTEVVFRFTDRTYDELKKAGRSPRDPISSPASGLLADLNTVLKKKLRYNIHSRILQDVVSDAPGGYFAAFIKGKQYSSKEAFFVDPHGAPSIIEDVVPEEVEFLTYEETVNAKVGVWAAYHYPDEYAQGTASGSQDNANYDVEHQDIDATIERNGKLTGKAITTVVAKSDSVRVIPLHLFHTLRVQKVTMADGKPLAFIQEDKDEDAAFAVILGAPLAKGERITFQTEYSGTEAVHSLSGGNYYPVARTSWYPNSRIGDFATYDLTFRVPKGLTMVATGTLVSQREEGGQSITQWKSDLPQTVAGFNFGEFKKQENKLDTGELLQAYTNANPPDSIAGIQSLPGHERLGTMDTAGLMKKAMAEAQLAVPLYTDYFGPSSFKRLAITQQAAFGFGQSWPTLVYLPITYFFDNTTRHYFGMDNFDTRGYFRVVGPHEIAHQWWGHTVTWDSYRDQWLSEGFAEFSASLFIQQFFKPEEFKAFWDGERQLITEKNYEGKRAMDIGPVTLGYRLGTTKSGFDIPRRLIYPKGGYILHMVRMLMWDSQSGDARFKEMMRDFVNTYRGRAATTEDFKGIVEKHMRADMNITGNGKMDWFFDEWVYGTQIPSYKFEHSFSKGADGAVMLNVKLTQSGVDDSFVMAVPVYLDFGNGKIFRIGAIPLKGNTSFERSIALRGIQEPPKRAVINYFNDVLTRD